VSTLKHYCYTGVGALYVRRRPRVRVEAPQSGGGQERGMRSGTLPTPLCVGLGAACELSNQEMEVGLYRRCTWLEGKCESVVSASLIYSIKNLCTFTSQCISSVNMYVKTGTLPV